MRKRALKILAILACIYIYMHPLPFVFGHISKKLDIDLYNSTANYLDPVSSLWINGFGLLVVVSLFILLFGFICWYIIHGGE
jgi:hypothetical protein